jgi:hypothetical protein
MRIIIIMLMNTTKYYLNKTNMEIKHSTVDVRCVHNFKVERVRV